MSALVLFMLAAAPPPPPPAPPMPVARGGSGVGSLACTTGQVLSSDGGVFFCTGATAAVSTATPITVTGGSVTCTTAAANVGGCLDGNAANSQTLTGYKHLPQLLYAEDSYVSSGFDNVPTAVYAPTGAIASRYLLPPTSGQGLELRGRRTWGDQASNVSVTSTTWRDGGYLLGVNTPVSCGAQLWGVTESGNIDFGGSYEKDCSSSSAGGIMRDRSTFSGHHALSREPGYYLVISGGLGAREDAIETDGGRPWCDGGSWTRSLSDGGCVYNYAGAHGDVNIAASYPMRAGVVAEIYNPLSGVGAYTDHRAFWDSNGAYAQNHGLSFAQFPPAPQSVVFTNLGQFRFGTYPSTQMYDFTGNRWYYSNGTAWAQFLDTSAIVTVSQGGTGAAPGAADQVLVSTGTSAATWRTLPSCSNGTTSKLLYDSSTDTFSCGTDQTGGGGGGNFVEATVDFGSSGSDTVALAVTGQAWVTSTSKILCTPTLMATSDRSEGAEDAVIDGLTVAAHSRVEAVGFTITVATANGRAFGRYLIHCTGSSS